MMMVLSNIQCRKKTLNLTSTFIMKCESQLLYNRVWMFRRRFIPPLIMVMENYKYYCSTFFFSARAHLCFCFNIYRSSFFFKSVQIICYAFQIHDWHLSLYWIILHSIFFIWILVSVNKIMPYCYVWMKVRIIKIIIYFFYYWLHFISIVMTVD